MKYFLLVCVASIVLAVESADYTPLEKASGFDPGVYGLQSAKAVRSIGRSYAYQLMKKQEFSVYMESLSAITDGASPTAAQDYAKTYVGHVGVVGVGIVLALALFLGFLLCWCCMLCCNRSQKQTSTMAMWRMIWGAILIVLLAASVAGLLILGLSGSEFTSVETSSTSTIDTLGDGITDYLDDTNQQIETLKTDHLEVLFGELDPLFGTAVSNSATAVKALNTPHNVNDEIGNIVNALNSLDTIISDAETEVTEIYTLVDRLEGDINDINANVDVCKEKVDACEAAQTGCYGQLGVDATTFDSKFDTNTLNKAELQSILDDLASAKSFDGKTLSEWATEVNDEWDSLDTTISEQATSAQTDFENMLSDAKSDFQTKLNDEVQVKLQDIQGDITTNQDKYKKQVSATIKYLKDTALLKEADETDVPQSIIDIFSNEMAQYGLFAIFVLVCVILGLLALTVIIGLLSTVLGCCKADNDVPPTERSTGCCGTLLMCTSYCSVILCSISTLIAAILVTIVMLEEGMCKDYSDGKLLDSINSISTDLDLNLDLNKVIGDLLQLEDDFVLSDFMEQCEGGSTLFSALNLQKDSMLLGSFSIQSLQDEVNNQINSLDATTMVDGLSIDVSFISDTSSLETSKTDLAASWDVTSLQNVRAELDGDLLPDDSVLTPIPGKIDDFIQTAGSDEYGLGLCKTAVNEIINTNSKTDGVAETVEALKTPLDDLIALSPDPATEAGTEIDNLISALNNVEATLTETAIKEIIKTEIEAALSSAGTIVTSFIDFLYGQFQDTILNCQPLSATYETVMNFTCDGIFIHLTLVYCGLSLIGISLLFYMCVSRCLARYFIKYSQLHPDDEGIAENGCFVDTKF